MHGMISNQMTLDQYREARATLRGLYGDSKREAGVRYEQELSRLFYRSGLRAEDLAKEEGKSQGTVYKLLKFGRFLDFFEGTENSQKLLFGLNYGRFDNCWRQTKEKGEGPRFREVLRMLQEQPGIS
jgi:hypothetical protein